ncbi:MAG: hypothetical protein EON93_09165 [Burkholderiales bacterium]|nr:MAG: hypothetical protein EON93_09165 [Burkholderiales bacterium]
MQFLSKLAEIKRRDDRRPGFPGEHLVTFGVGALLLMASGRARGPAMRWIGRTLGTSFMARSAAGRDGLRRLVR